MDYYSTFLFVLVTSITPGPNNLSSFVFSASLGFKKTLNYVLGIVTGVIFVLILSGLLIHQISFYFENIASVLKWFAAAYIIYLAYKSLTMNVAKNTETPKAPSFINGLLLQLINPKGLMFALTLFSTFLLGIITKPIHVVFAALLVSCVTISCVSLWSFAGGFLMEHLKNKRILNIVRISLALLLVFFAISIIINT